MPSPPNRAPLLSGSICPVPPGYPPGLCLSLRAVPQACPPGLRLAFPGGGGAVQLTEQLF